MMKPMSNKTPEMKQAIEGMFPGTAAAIAAHKCPLCHNPISGFRDAISEREYEISGLCQGCQDSIFMHEVPIDEHMHPNDETRYSREADKVDGYDRDDLGESPDY